MDSFQSVSRESSENLCKQLVYRTFPCQKITWNLGILYSLLFLQYIVDSLPYDSHWLRLFNSSNKVLGKTFKLKTVPFKMILQVPFSRTRNISSKFPLTLCACQLQQFHFQIIMYFLFNVYYLQCFILENNIRTFTVIDGVQK